MGARLELFSSWMGVRFVGNCPVLLHWARLDEFLRWQEWLAHSVQLFLLLLLVVGCFCRALLEWVEVEECSACLPCWLRSSTLV